MATATSITRKKIRAQIAASLTTALEALHIHKGSKKVQKLVEKTSKQIAAKVLKEMKKVKKTKAKKATKEVGKKEK